MSTPSKTKNATGGEYPPLTFAVKDKQSRDLALMCYSHDYVTYDKDIYISGDWAISKDRRQGLIGRKVVLYEGKGKEAYIGGEIVAIVDRGKATWLRGKGKPSICAVVFKRISSLDGFTGHLLSTKGQQNVQYF